MLGRATRLGVLVWVFPCSLRHVFLLVELVRVGFGIIVIRTRPRTRQSMRHDPRTETTTGVLRRACGKPKSRASRTNFEITETEFGSLGRNTIGPTNSSYKQPRHPSVDQRIHRISNGPVCRVTESSFPNFHRSQSSWEQENKISARDTHFW